MKIEFEDRVWDLDVSDVLLTQAETIQAFTGLAPKAWLESLADQDNPAFFKGIRCMYWLMLEQNGVTGFTPATVDFKVARFSAAFGEAAAAAQAAQAAEAEPDPTQAASEPSPEPPAPHPEPGGGPPDG